MKTHTPFLVIMALLFASLACSVFPELAPTPTAQTIVIPDAGVLPSVSEMRIEGDFDNPESKVCKRVGERFTYQMRATIETGESALLVREFEIVSAENGGVAILSLDKGKTLFLQAGSGVVSENTTLTIWNETASVEIPVTIMYFAYLGQNEAGEHCFTSVVAPNQ